MVPLNTFYLFYSIKAVRSAAARKLGVVFSDCRKLHKSFFSLCEFVSIVMKVPSNGV